MSNYRGNGDECPHGCGLTYGQLRTGLRYYDVFVMLMDYKDDPAEWKYKRRRTVLGHWHQIKKQMWEYHCDEGGCELDPRNLAPVHVLPVGDAEVGEVGYALEVPF